MDNYLDELLCRMKLSMDYSVLDVGCGIGEIALPLSRRVSRVTALDYSPVALEMLREKASRLGYVNIKTLHGDFPTFSVGSDVEEHDVVLASRSLPMGDLRKSLTLINQAAKLLCYLTWGTGRNELTEGICSILGGNTFLFLSI
jgi:SAM-dependent methyltransferase